MKNKERGAAIALYAQAVSVMKLADPTPISGGQERWYWSESSFDTSEPIRKARRERASLAKQLVHLAQETLSLCDKDLEYTARTPHQKAPREVLRQALEKMKAARAAMITQGTAGDPVYNAMVAVQKAMEALRLDRQHMAFVDARRTWHDLQMLEGVTARAVARLALTKCELTLAVAALELAVQQEYLELLLNDPEPCQSESQEEST